MTVPAAPRAGQGEKPLCCPEPRCGDRGMGGRQTELTGAGGAGRAHQVALWLCGRWTRRAGLGEQRGAPREERSERCGELRAAGGWNGGSGGCERSLCAGNSAGAVLRVGDVL